MNLAINTVPLNGALAPLVASGVQGQNGQLGILKTFVK